MTTADCRTCRQPIVQTVYGWGHLTNPGFGHHVPRPATRRGDDRPGVVASAGRRTADKATA